MAMASFFRPPPAFTLALCWSVLQAGNVGENWLAGYMTERMIVQLRSEFYGHEYWALISVFCFDSSFTTWNGRDGRVVNLSC